MDQRSGVVIFHGVLLLHLIVCSQGLAVSTRLCPGGRPDRGERMFFLAPRVPPQRSNVPTVTETYTSTRLISEVWLSSCVTYATALPNCPRDARREILVENRLDPREMALNPTKVQPILSTSAPHLPEGELRENERKLRTFSKPFWEDLVGLAFPLRSGEAERPTPPLLAVPSASHRDKSTATRTVTVTATKRVKGPKTVVSFSITGCLPSKLPFDLERCDEPERAASLLRNPLDVSTEEPPAESSTVPSAETAETEVPQEESITSDSPPTTTEQGYTSEVPTVETSPESEQMIPAPNESVTGAPEEHEELGSGFAK